MDERIFRAKIGYPIPAWDASHRLPISGCVGPEVSDSATIFRINSTYMEVSDQPHMMRHWLAGGALMSFLTAILFLGVGLNVFYFHPPTHGDFADIFMVVILTLSPMIFAVTAYYLGRDEFFSLSRRPIRFNRCTKKLYAVRKRDKTFRSFSGDIFCEAPWDENSIFCVHQGPEKFDLQNCYHIRCYQTDAKGNVTNAFSIGREWQGVDGMRELLAQWNYWCLFMNQGPAALPKPLLYLSEREKLSDSFLYCLYEMGFSLPQILRTIISPFAILITLHRIISLWTCRQPIWTKSVLEDSYVDPADIYDQPRGETPVGWAEAVRARREDRYPRFPSCEAVGWSGLADPMKNAKQWVDRPPVGEKQ